MSKAIGIWDPQANNLQVWRLHKLHRFQKDKAGSNKAFTLLASKKGGHWITEISLDEYGTRSKSLSLEKITSHIMIKKHNKRRNGRSATYEITSSMNFSTPPETYYTKKIINASNNKSWPIADQVLHPQGLYEFIPHLRKFHNSCVRRMVLPKRRLLRPKLFGGITLN